MSRQPKLGSGKRFAKVQSSIEKEGYTKKQAGAIAAHIGREKYGNKKMAKLAANAKAGSRASGKK